MEGEGDGEGVFAWKFKGGGRQARRGLKGERTPIDNTTSDFERCRKAIKII